MYKYTIFLSLCLVVPACYFPTIYTFFSLTLSLCSPFLPPLPLSSFLPVPLLSPSLVLSLRPYMKMKIRLNKITWTTFDARDSLPKFYLIILVISSLLLPLSLFRELLSVDPNSPTRQQQPRYWRHAARSTSYALRSDAKTEILKSFSLCRSANWTFHRCVALQDTSQRMACMQLFCSGNVPLWLSASLRLALSFPRLSLLSVYSY